MASIITFKRWTVGYNATEHKGIYVESLDFDKFISEFHRRKRYFYQAVINRNFDRCHIINLSKVHCVYPDVPFILDKNTMEVTVDLQSIIED